MSPLRSMLLVFGATLALACVVSTHAGPGQEPVVPLPPQPPVAPEVARRAGEPLEVGARHMLVAYKGAQHARPYITRSREEAQAFAEELRARVLGGEDFATIAKENSDDAGSAAMGGDLGTFRREDMVPEFSDAAFALQPGGVSAVVESAFGFHVIQRTE